MPKFIALLRGINVGKAKRVPMADLRTLMGDLGYTDVVTLLNSGNAVFSASRGTPPKHAADLAAAIFTKLKVEVPTIVLSATALAAVVSENPLAEGAQNHAQFLVVFGQEPASLKALDYLTPLLKPLERFVIGPHAAYLDCASGILNSKAGAALLTKRGPLVTTRNWATVLKLQALAQAK